MTAKKPKNTVITFKLDADLKTTFQMACKRQGFHTSLILRELMKDYIKNNAQTDLLKDRKFG